MSNSIYLKLKYYLLTIGCNLIIKSVLYILFMLFLISIDLKYFSIHILEIMFIILSIELIFEILINTEINEKQQKYLSYFYGLIAIPSAIPWLSNNPNLFVIPITCAVFFSVLGLFSNKFNTSRSYLSILIIIFIISYLINIKDITILLYQFLLILIISIIPLRIVSLVPDCIFSMDDKLEKTILENKQIIDQFKEYFKLFQKNSDQYIIINNSIYIVHEKIIYDIYKTQIKNETIINKCNSVLINKEEILRYRIKNFKNDWKQYILYLFIPIFDIQLFDKYTIFIRDNYDELLISDENDKKLWYSDVELIVIRNGLNKTIYNINSCIKSYEKIPSDTLLDDLKQYQKESEKYITDFKIIDKINYRMNLAGNTLNKNQMELYQFNNMKKSIDEKILFITQLKYAFK